MTFGSNGELAREALNLAISRARWFEFKFELHHGALTDEACLHVTRSLKNYDPEQGTTFSQFVRPQLNQALNRAAIRESRRLERHLPVSPSHLELLKGRRSRSSLYHGSSFIPSDNPFSFSTDGDNDEIGEASTVGGGRKEGRRPQKTPPELILEAEQREAIRAAIAELPDRQRLIMSLFYDGYRLEEVTALAGCSRRTVSRERAAALVALRAKLEDFGPVSRPPRYKDDEEAATPPPDHPPQHDAQAPLATTASSAAGALPFRPSRKQRLLLEVHQ